MFISLFGAVESGIIYGIMALGVYFSFRVLDFPDLTVDGSFVTGAAIATIAIVNGIPAVIATLLGALAGFISGCITGLLHTKGKINPLLSGILMMIALYSINLRILGRPYISLRNESTVWKQLAGFWEKTKIDQTLNNLLEMTGLNRTPSTWAVVFVMILAIIIIKLLVDFYLKTEIGLAIRATGDNQAMIRSLSANTDNLIVIGIGISNALVAFSGALIAQYFGFADIGAGIGLIIIGLASVIIGEALFGTKTIARTTMAVIFGAIIYRIVVTIALRTKFLETGDMRLITAVLVIAALITPKIIQDRREKKKRMQKRQALEQQNRVEGVS